MDKKENRKKKKVKLNDTIIGVAQKEVTQKYGEAASQMIFALKGKRYASDGSELIHKGRNLNQINKYKTNPEHEYSNIKQQAGFAGELVKEARDNKAAILNGDRIRTRTTDGIGKSNDQKHDHVKVDENLNVINGSESQMKIKGHYSTPNEVQESSKNIVKEMVSKKWEKYSDSIMDLPSEQVEPAKAYAREEAQNLRKKASDFKKNGNLEKAQLLEEKAKDFENVEKRIRDSGVSSQDAIDARLKPKQFVAKEVVLDSHNAGIEAAKASAIFGISVSGAQNLYAVVCEGKSLEEAIIDVTDSTVKTGAVAYAVGASGTAIKSMMHSSSNHVIRALGKTNAPAMMATAVLEVGKSFHRYAIGDIDEEELLEELGEKGTCMVAASYGSALGTAILPGVGTVIGGMIGYTISSLYYKETLAVLKNARISEERRRILEQINGQAIIRLKSYQEEIKRQSKEEYYSKEQFYSNVFSDINLSIVNNNIDSFFSAINTLGKEFDIKFQFENFEEFDVFMSDKDSLLVL